MLKFLKNLFGIGPYSENRPVDAVAPGGAPYKVPEPVEAVPAPVAEVAPVVEVAPEQKVRKPRTPKEETAVKEKAPTKAKAPKLTVVKAAKSK